jgi:hypothetical protein
MVGIATAQSFPVRAAEIVFATAIRRRQVLPAGAYAAADDLAVKTFHVVSPLPREGLDQVCFSGSAPVMRSNSAAMDGLLFLAADLLDLLYGKESGETSAKGRIVSSSKSRVL